MSERKCPVGRCSGDEASHDIGVLDEYDSRKAVPKKPLAWNVRG